jgi:hypothetical protein
MSHSMGLALAGISPLPLFFGCPTRGLPWSFGSWMHLYLETHGIVPVVRDIPYLLLMSQGIWGLLLTF